MKQTIRERILITGVSGLLGSNLAYYFKDRFDVVGLYNTHPVKINAVHTQQANILSEDSIKKLMNTFHPTIIIHCASLTNIEYCEVNKDKTYLVNVLGTKNIVDNIKNSEAKIIYISSDSVYDGCKGKYSETDPVNPQNYYGISKFNSELEALKKVNSLVIRTNFFGWNVRDKFSIAEWILHELIERKQIKGFKDVYFSSIYTFELAKILDKAIDQDLSGIYNCGSCDSISKYDFALLIAKHFQLEGRLVQPISIDDSNLKVKRGKNLSLNIDKLRTAQKNNLPTIKESIDAFYRDYKNGLHQAIRKNNTLNPI
jgi:dTDP-4-dehydrorhamnose reductase